VTVKLMLAAGSTFTTILNGTAVLKQAAAC
jgi:hypothetical protein